MLIFEESSGLAPDISVVIYDTDYYFSLNKTMQLHCKITFYDFSQNQVVNFMSIFLSCLLIVLIYCKNGSSDDNSFLKLWLTNAFHYNITNKLVLKQ